MIAVINSMIIFNGMHSNKKERYSVLEAIVKRLLKVEPLQHMPEVNTQPYILRPLETLMPSQSMSSLLSSSSNSLMRSNSNSHFLNLLEKSEIIHLFEEDALGAIKN
ncbi:unnamed protein product [Euphydryas editha]|uniref:Uncharacterized protein n=1 Tax=Euphydryas editha TaxID=104508 RepID=A0AAU9TR55_EUPED|nr:unnamed protein product [Euphydryas editha]